ncbi:hypothetical protein SG34_010665 [Thalassomonas viridans]|uniref:Uncharacterized protein n=1 Tax=Thalassomonas viridans TaxID=137584 RepID=A0AAE9Z914_9GAMM|nr:hypothetical protein [Thalassomonas viridans]WDE07307.1 hypothetical protein SG34_010665 [Thalassomonas viridans]
MKILSQIIDWLFHRQPKKPAAKATNSSVTRTPKARAGGKSVTKPSAKKKGLPPQSKNPRTAKTKPAGGNKSGDNPLRQTKSYQKTLTLLNHVHRQKLLERVRVRATEHPQLTAAILKGWLKKQQKKRSYPPK